MLGAGNAGQNAKGAEVAQKKYQKYCLDVFSVFCGVFAFFCVRSQCKTWIPACAGMTLFYRAFRATVGSAFFCANLLQHQPVAHARFSQQMLGAGGVKLQFAAQVGHVNAQVVRVLGVVGAPHFAQQLALG